MKLASLKDCTGCGVCAAVCGKRCIQIKIADNGFYYPQINAELCVECGRCASFCHVINPNITIASDKSYYCGWESSEQKRFEASSGGAFGALAEKVISKGGVVHAAAFSSDKKFLCHQSSEQISLNELKKSKYLESYMGDTADDIKKNLQGGKTVLFCGTPCQVSGVRKLFGYRYDNLILCDFLCHGVPSSVRYRQYLAELEKMFGDVVTDVGFRTKKFGWKTYCIVIKFKKGNQYTRLANEDPYYKQFFANINLRPSCYSCNRVAESVADITLGDFWTARKLGIDDDKGCSLIVCNTPKGKHLLEQLPNFESQEIEKEYISYAFTPHLKEEKTTPINEPFFQGFKISLKDKITCALLRNKFSRAIIYKIK